MKKVYDPLEEKNVKTLEGYTHIRAYHGCRPLSIEGYLKNGLQKRSKNAMLSEAIGRLAGLGLPEDVISHEFNTVWEGYHKNVGDNGGVYLDAWKTEFYNWSSHYLIYGSETINATAVALAPNEWLVNRYRDELKKTGKPTLIVCDVPLTDIQDSYRSSLEKAMPISRSAGFKVPYVLKENIVDVLYPTELPDAYYGNLKYRFPGNGANH